MALYDPARHEPLRGVAWDEETARAAIRRVVDDANRSFTPEGLWPIHPLDVSPERPPDCLKPLYHGAAGVIWALERLDREGAAPLAHDFGPIALSLADRSREDIRRHEGVRDYVGDRTAGYLIGETGLHLFASSHAPSATIEDELHESIKSQLGDVCGVVWGGAGAMLAALFMFERTSDGRWRALVEAHANALWARWDYLGAARCHVWDQHLYGDTGALLGALHGFAANALALIRCRDLLDPARVRETEARIRETLIATSMREDGEANWPMGVGPTTRPDPGRLLLQHCMGAPGMIQVLARLTPDPDVDALLAAAGVLVWRAGPPAKLPGLCHGAPGNGYALLRLYDRTGDAVWLARARAFAMHAVAQADAALAVHGQRKYSVWTGDLGLALFLWDCVGGDAALPMLDVF